MLFPAACGDRICFGAAACPGGALPAGFSCTRLNAATMPERVASSVETGFGFATDGCAAAVFSVAPLTGRFSCAGGPLFAGAAYPDLRFGAAPAVDVVGGGPARTAFAFAARLLPAPGREGLLSFAGLGDRPRFGDGEDTRGGADARAPFVRRAFPLAFPLVPLAAVVARETGMAFDFAFALGGPPAVTTPVFAAVPDFGFNASSRRAE
mmetsp:Transcript_971/g.2028  ORF Transcript_971/g.2028 Transcript_971/m.2028 type:complete len:209 (+) Transcript_971:987-1613(+)